MRLTKNNGFYMMLMAIGMLSSCSSEVESNLTTVNEPLIDFKALSDFDSNNGGFNQIFLRIQLLNSGTDILKYGINTPAEHQSRLNYYRTEFKNDVFILSGKDTVPCYDLHAERLYMDIPYMNFILTFQHKISPEDIVMINEFVFTNRSILIEIDQNIQAQ